MYARLTLHMARMEMRAESEHVADQMAGLLKGQEGLKSIIFIRDFANGEVGTFSVWESKEAALAADAALGSQIRQIVAASGTHLDQPAVRREFDVYEPKA